jgi:hypothetical protein
MGRVNPFYKQGHAPAGCVALVEARRRLASTKVRGLPYISS